MYFFFSFFYVKFILLLTNLNFYRFYAHSNKNLKMKNIANNKDSQDGILNMQNIFPVLSVKERMSDVGIICILVHGLQDNIRLIALGHRPLHAAARCNWIT